METNEEIEMLLWEYMDGTCNEADIQRICILIERDEVWKQKYAELSELQAELSKSLQLEQPSLRFTKNVMDTVATVSIAPATKKYINKYVIRGIAAFFIVTITTLIGYAVISVKWSTTSSFSKSNLNLSTLFNSTTINIFITVNIALGLVLLDTFLRRKRSQHTN